MQPNFIYSIYQKNLNTGRITFVKQDISTFSPSTKPGQQLIQNRLNLMKSLNIDEHERYCMSIQEMGESVKQWFNRVGEPVSEEQAFDL